jgi:hypothetical protein
MTSTKETRPPFDSDVGKCGIGCLRRPARPLPPAPPARAPRRPRPARSPKRPRPPTGPSRKLTPVRVVLQWVPQSQFAGYYAAKDKGFYAEEGPGRDHHPRRAGHRARSGRRL